MAILNITVNSNMFVQDSGWTSRPCRESRYT